VPETFKEELKRISLISLFVIGFIFMFSLTMSKANLDVLNYLLLSIFYGVVTFIVASSFVFGIRYFTRKHATIKLGYWLLQVFGLIISISLANVVLRNMILGQDAFDDLSIVVNTFLIAIFPVVILAFINQSKSEKQNTRKAQELYEALRSTKKSNADNCVLAVESMENYVHIYEKRDSLLIKTTKRQTLKSVLDDDKYHTLVQSHRSYLFNPNEVEKAEGNAQGLVITMSHSDCPKVLVSRSFMKNVKALL
jgi:hypothetical protein